MNSFSGGNAELNSSSRSGADLAFGHGRAARDRTSPPDRTVVLIFSRTARIFRSLLGEQHADRELSSSNFAEGDDARAVLADARAVTQAGFAAVAGARIDFRQAVTH
jgi:hypothetical protein